jgi:hypothetical protein
MLDFDRCGNQRCTRKSEQAQIASAPGICSVTYQTTSIYRNAYSKMYLEIYAKWLPHLCLVLTTHTSGPHYTYVWTRPHLCLCVTIGSNTYTAIGQHDKGRYDRWWTGNRLSTVCLNVGVSIFHRDWCVKFRMMVYGKAPSTKLGGLYIGYLQSVFIGKKAFEDNH